MAAWRKGKGSGKGSWKGLERWEVEWEEVIKRNRQTLEGGGVELLLAHDARGNQQSYLCSGIWGQDSGTVWRESANTPAKWKLRTLIPGAV